MFMFLSADWLIEISVDIHILEEELVDVIRNSRDGEKYCRRNQDFDLLLVRQHAHAHHHQQLQ